MKIICNYITHRNKECVLLRCDYNAQLNKIFRMLDFVKYSNTHKSWYIPTNKELLKQVMLAVKGMAQIDVKGLKVASSKLQIANGEMQVVNRKPQTINHKQ